MAEALEPAAIVDPNNPVTGYVLVIVTQRQSRADRLYQLPDMVCVGGEVGFTQA